MMTNIGTRGIHMLTWIVCVPLMVLIGIVQAVGTVLAAISAVVFKAISVLMILGMAYCSNSLPTGAVIIW